MSDERGTTGADGVPKASDVAAEPPEPATAPDTDDDRPIDRPAASYRKALSWSYVLTSSRTAFTLLTSLVLARILGPEAFGLVAMGLAFVAFVDLLVRQGLIPAIVQRPDLTPSHLDAAFWITTSAAFALTPVVIAASGWWANANDTPDLAPVLRWLSLLIILHSAAVVPEARIIRSMDFRVLAIRTSTATLVGGIAGIIAALLGAGPWALVVQQLVTASLSTFLIWTMTDWRPKFRFRAERARELLGFSGSTALASVAVYLQRSADALLIGLFFGPLVTGLYRMAARLVSIALEVASGALRQTALPELSRFQGDHDAFLDRIVEIVRLSGLLAIPLLGGLVATSAPLLGLLGEEWLPAVQALQLMAVLAAVQTVGIFTGPMLQAAGHPGVFAWLTWATALLSVTTFVGSGLLITSTDPARQITLLSAARTVVMGLGYVLIVVPVLNAKIALRPRRLLAAVLPALLASGGGIAVVSAARELSFIPWPSQPLLDLLASGSLALVTMMGLLFALEPKAREYAQVARNRLGAKATGRIRSV
jgi:O-antigen/teichoic acid export membrane protein